MQQQNSPSLLTLGRVAKTRRDICRRAACPHLEILNFNDPCAACPEGHWGRYEIAGCEDGNRIVPDARLPHAGNNGSLRPGSLLSSLIFKVTGQSTKTCGVCGARMGMMDRNGWRWCWKNRSTIIGWVLDEAAKRGHKINNQVALALLKATFVEIRGGMR
jgi:hypothetical protein